MHFNMFPASRFADRTDPAKAAACSFGNDEKFPGGLPGILNFLKDEGHRRVLHSVQPAKQLLASHAERVYRIFPLRQTLIESLTLTPHGDRYDATIKGLTEHGEKAVNRHGALSGNCHEDKIH